jgi:hypothetical protein
LQSSDVVTGGGKFVSKKTQVLTSKDLVVAKGWQGGLSHYDRGHADRKPNAGVSSDSQGYSRFHLFLPSLSSQRDQHSVVVLRRCEAESAKAHNIGALLDHSPRTHWSRREPWMTPFGAKTQVPLHTLSMQRPFSHTSPLAQLPPGGALLG